MVQITLSPSKIMTLNILYTRLITRVLVLPAFTILIGCSPKTADQSGTPTPTNPNNATSSDTTQVLVVNEGLFQRNNSTLTLISPKANTAVTDLFELKTGLKLGDTGNDIAVYGNKIYVVVNVSSYVAVLEKSTYRLLRQINLFSGSIARQPRQITFAGPRAFVSCFDGNVVVIDTNTLNQETVLAAGRNPEGICVSGDYMMVANSGGLSAPNFDNRISVFALPTLNFLGNITVDANPTTILAGQPNEAYVYAKADYSAANASWTRISAQSLSVLSREVIPSAISAAGGDTIIQLRSIQQNPTIAIINTRTGTVSETVWPVVKNIQSPYRLIYNNKSQEVWISDSKDYVTTAQVWRFNKFGALINKYNAGLNPGAMTLLP